MVAGRARAHGLVAILLDPEVVQMARLAVGAGSSVRGSDFHHCQNSRGRQLAR